MQLQTLTAFSLSVRRLLDICHGQRSEQGNQLILVLVFEHVDQDLSAYLEKCPPPGLSPGVIKVGPPPVQPGKLDLVSRSLQTGGSQRWSLGSLHSKSVITAGVATGMMKNPALILIGLRSGQLRERASHARAMRQ